VRNQRARRQELYDSAEDIRRNLSKVWSEMANQVSRALSLDIIYLNVIAQAHKVTLQFECSVIVALKTRWDGRTRSFHSPDIATSLPSFPSDIRHFLHEKLIPVPDTTSETLRIAQLEQELKQSRVRIEQLEGSQRVLKELEQKIALHDDDE
jgi:hypothetical protein